MNSSLHNEKIYSPLWHKRITTLAQIRNDAAHGNSDKFKSEDVKGMISTSSASLLTISNRPATSSANRRLPSALPKAVVEAKPERQNLLPPGSHERHQTAHSPTGAMHDPQTLPLGVLSGLPLFLDPAMSPPYDLHHLLRA